MIVYVVETGDGDDGSTFTWHGIFSTRQKASDYIHNHRRVGGQLENFYAPHIDAWVVDAGVEKPV